MDTALRIIALILAESTPLVFAGLGETLAERSGVINLSLDGTIMLSCMVGFVVSYLSGNILFGFLAAIIIGAAIAFVIAYGSIKLGHDQITLGFVLTMLTIDLASFLGNPFVRLPGPSVAYFPIPVLKDIPFLGILFFDQNILTYGSFVLIIVCWCWIFKTRPGLELRSAGENPKAAYGRGINVNLQRYLYTVLGGGLVGLAGASYSLSVKLGWSYNHTLGMGWIALAIVIFGGWNPVRVAVGAYLFGVLMSFGGILQGIWPEFPSQIFQSSPFVLMILLLVLVNSAWIIQFTNWLPHNLGLTLAGLIRVYPPAGLGKRFDQ